MKKVAFFVFLVFLSVQAYAAEDKIINLAPEKQAPAWKRGKLRFAPGVAIQLPDGRRGIIETVLPDGQLQTDLGVLLLPDGSLVENPEKQAVIWDAEKGQIQQPGETPVAPAVETPQKEDVPEKPDVAEESAVAVPTILPKTPESAAVETPKAATPEKEYTLAELLPVTPDKKPATPEKVEQPKKQEPAQEQKKAETPKKAEKPKKEEPAKKVEKPKNGQELRIPDDAVKSGSLAFLEGCWEGRRPEYYSKRTIRECFCFDQNGGSGKRRIFDIQGNRSCIGSSRASLSKQGVLSVTSQGAACDDGERWGQAEMVCKNSGQRTPCSWVFRDAQNGRQAYTIPFVKVESCRR